MIIAKISGGLGNQFFQYAMARRLAVKHNTQLLIDTLGYGAKGEPRPEELANFNIQLQLFRFQIQARSAELGEIRRLKDDYFRATARDRAVRKIRLFWPAFLQTKSHIVEKQYRFQAEALDWPDDTYLQGFWQSPKYFEDIASFIRKELQPVDASIRESANEAVASLKARHPQVVSLHIRRGDIAHAFEVLGKKNITYGAPVTLDYIHSAMARFEPQACFFVFSDTPKDIAWCRENIKAKNVEFSKAESDIWDFTAMSACDHHIISNSTFSWWAAWLNSKPGKRVVAPRIWSFPKARVQMPTEDLLPDSWIKI